MHSGTIQGTRLRVHISIQSRLSLDPRPFVQSSVDPARSPVGTRQSDPIVSQGSLTPCSQVAIQGSMPNARLISANATAQHGTFLARNILLRHFVILIPSATVIALIRARACRVNCCCPSEWGTLDLQSASCYVGASFQANPPGSTSRSKSVVLDLYATG